MNLASAESLRRAPAAAASTIAPRTPTSSASAIALRQRRRSSLHANSWTARTSGAQRPEDLDPHSSHSTLNPPGPQGGKLTRRGVIAPRTARRASTGARSWTMPKVRYLLWDFGDTLVDQRWMWPSPDGAPDWTARYQALPESELDERWNLGELTTEELAVALTADLVDHARRRDDRTSKRAAVTCSSTSTHGRRRGRGRFPRRSSP